MHREEDLIVCRKGIVQARPGIVKCVVEIEKRLAGASPHEMNVAVAYRHGRFAIAHALAPATTGASLLICLSLGITSWANKVMLFWVNSVGTLPTEKFATRSPKPTR